VRNEWFISQPAVFVRRSAIDVVGEVNADLHLVMDWELWLRLALKKVQITYLPQTIANFRVWPDAKTQSKSEQSGREKLRVLDELFATERLPESVRTVEAEAYSNVHKFIARSRLKQGQLGKARHSAFQAARYYPRCLLERQMISIVVRSLTGATMAARVKRWIKPITPRRRNQSRPEKGRRRDRD
jgi:hypothetical protein